MKDSFFKPPSKGIFKCLGCGKGGNAVNFLMGTRDAFIMLGRSTINYRGETHTRRT